jgi:methionine-rich copper-binding protein CopC
MNPSSIPASAGRTLLFAGVALVLALGLFAAPRSASAHAEVESSSPAAGATVDAGITSISITFDEEVSVDASTAQLEGPGGAVAGATAAVDRANRTLMTITTAPLSAGTYTLRWTAVTEDDNGTANGTLSFTVAAVGSTSAPGSGSGATTSGGSGAALPATGVGQIDLIMSLLGGIALALLGLGFATAFRARA